MYPMGATEISPVKVAMNYTGLECPFTGDVCPSRANIDLLCEPAYDDDATVEELELAETDSRKRNALLMGHNVLINRYGCNAEAGFETCPPSVASNEQPGVRGAKRLIKLILGGVAG
jgi:hypothetical protein